MWDELERRTAPERRGGMDRRLLGPPRRLEDRELRSVLSEATTEGDALGQAMYEYNQRTDAQRLRERVEFIAWMFAIAFVGFVVIYIMANR